MWRISAAKAVQMQNIKHCFQRADNKVRPFFTISENVHAPVKSAKLDLNARIRKFACLFQAMSEANFLGVLFAIPLCVTISFTRGRMS